MRVQNVFTRYITNAGRRNRTHEWNTGQCECRGRGNHRHEVGIVLHIVAENGDDYLRFVAITLCEERADRTIDQARDQRLTLRRSALALEIAPWNFPRSEILFLIIDGQREKVGAGARLMCSHDCGQDNRLAVCSNNSTISLARNLASLKDKLSATPFNFLFCNIEHSSVPSLAWAGLPTLLPSRSSQRNNDARPRDYREPDANFGLNAENAFSAT